MRNDDDEARRKAEEDPELREDIKRSVERDDEREPTPEKLEKLPGEAANEEAQDASTTAQAPTNAPERTQKEMVVSPSAVSSPNGNRRGGPSSPEGKAISRTNATTHGIFSSLVVLRNESRIDYDALLKGLSEDFQPEGSLESLLVEKLAMLLWRHRRLLLAEGVELTDTVDRRPLRVAVLENVSEPKRRHAVVGLFWGITDIAKLQECLDQLTILRNQIETDGLEFDRDRRILGRNLWAFGWGRRRTLGSSL